MKLYLAARFARREELLVYAEELRTDGYEITSRWLHSENKAFYNPGDGMTSDEAAHCAALDHQDVAAADLVLSFTEQRGQKLPGGGRHVEWGIGMALGKKLWLVGECEHVFHNAPGARHFGTWKSAREALRQEQPPTGSLTNWNLDPEAENYAGKLWEKYGSQTLFFHKALDAYVPGLANRIDAYLACRRGVYDAVRQAWEKAGRPGGKASAGKACVNGKASVNDDVARRYMEYAACSIWFEQCLVLANADLDVTEMQQRRDHLLTIHKNGIFLPFGSGESSDACRPRQDSKACDTPGSPVETEPTLDDDIDFDISSYREGDLG